MKIIINIYFCILVYQYMQKRITDHEKIESKRHYF